MTPGVWFALAALLYALAKVVEVMAGVIKRNNDSKDKVYNDARTDVEALKVEEAGLLRMVERLQVEVKHLSGRLDQEQSERRLDAAACREREDALRVENAAQSKLIDGLRAEVDDLRNIVQSGGVVP